jgi:hypothetical protein
MTPAKGAVTGFDGQYPVGLGVFLEDVTASERRVSFDREPFPAARNDQYFVEHGAGQPSASAFGSPPGPTYELVSQCMKLKAPSCRWEAEQEV